MSLPVKKFWIEDLFKPSHCSQYIERLPMGIYTFHVLLLSNPKSTDMLLYDNRVWKILFEGCNRGPNKSHFFNNSYILQKHFKTPFPRTIKKIWKKFPFFTFLSLGFWGNLLKEVIHLFYKNCLYEFEDNRIWSEPKQLFGTSAFIHRSSRLLFFYV